MDASVIEKVSKILGVSEEVIKNFNDEVAIHVFSNNYHDHAASIQYNFNPIDKWLETIEENRQLYERLIQAEKEKNEILQQLLAKK